MDSTQKVCVWLGPEGPLRWRVAKANERTEPEPGKPIFIVSFNDKGGIEQADVYYADGCVVGITPDMAVICGGPKYGGPGNNAAFITAEEGISK